MAFPLLGLAAGAATGAALKYGPHIFRYLYPRVAPKMVTGGKRLGQLMKQGLKNPVVIGGAIGSGLDNNILDIIINEAHAPTGPKLPTLPPLQTPPDITPRTEIPFGVGNHAPLPNAQELDGQALTPMAEVASRPEAQPSPNAIQPSPVDTRSSFEKFVQSEAYQKLQDLFAGMAAGPSGGSGWDALASGVQHLNKGDKQRQQVNQTVEYLKSKGYSEQEAIAMARNPQMLSALLTGSDQLKLSEGFQWYDNPETGQREMRPIKGSPQELEYNQKKREIAEWEENKKAAAQNAAYELHNTMGAIDKALNIIETNPEFATGGIGTIAQILPASDAKTLKNTFKQLEGGIFNKVIAGIKAQSKNGTVGVGPLSNEESRRIVQSYGVLDISDKPEELYQTLLNIKYMFNRFKELNEEEIYRLSNGMEVRQRRKSPHQSFTNRFMARGAGANLPTVNSREELDRYPAGTVVYYNGERIYKEGKE